MADRDVLKLLYGWMIATLDLPNPAINPWAAIKLSYAVMMLPGTHKPSSYYPSWNEHIYRLTFCVSECLCYAKAGIINCNYVYPYIRPPSLSSGPFHVYIGYF